MIPADIWGRCYSFKPGTEYTGGQHFYRQLIPVSGKKRCAGILLPKDKGIILISSFFVTPVYHRGDLYI